MKVDPLLSLSLYKANVGLWLDTARLLEESRQRWLELGARLAGGVIDESRDLAGQVASARDWPSLAAAPQNAAWRQAQHRLDGVRAIAETALENQAALSTGLQRALAGWQRKSVTALSERRSEMPLALMMREWLQAPDEGRSGGD